MKIIEEYYPVSLASIGSILIILLKIDLGDITNFSSILNASVTISSIVIAFMATMMSILITLVNTDVMKRIISADAEDVLIKFIKQTILSGLFLAIYSLVLYMFIESEGIVSKIMLVLFIFTLLYFLSTTFRIFQLVLRILSHVLKEHKIIVNNENEGKKVHTPKIKDTP